MERSHRSDLSQLARGGAINLAGGVANGVFGFTTPVSINYVGSKDGGTNTLLISENIDARWWIDTDPYRVAFTWSDIDQSMVGFWGINRSKGQSGNDQKDRQSEPESSSASSVH